MVKSVKSMSRMSAWSFRESGGRAAAFHLMRLFVLLLLFTFSACLYEDQVGKFDWKQSYIGKIKLSDFDTLSAAKKLIAVTEENVLAALNLKSGQIVWRQLLEGGPRGQVHALHVTDQAVTVSGSDPALVRGWDLTSGFLLWEWSLRIPTAAQRTFAGLAWVENDLLHHLLPVSGSHLELTTYNVRNGQNKGTTDKIPATWAQDRGCVLSPPYYTCVSGDDGKLVSLDVTSDPVRVRSRPLAHLAPHLGSARPRLRALPGRVPAVVVGDTVVALEREGFRVLKTRLKDETTTFHSLKINDAPVLLQAHYAKESFVVTATDMKTDDALEEYSNAISMPGANEPKIESTLCAKTAKNNLACRILASGVDDTLYFLQNPGKTAWVREEALSKIVQVEMIDLPISELEAVIETEFDNKEGNVFEMLIRRLKSQISQLRTITHGLVNNIIHPTKSSQIDIENDLLIRDEFGLHKIIIAVTEVGKIFAIDNLSGEIIWRRYIPFLTPFKSQLGNGKSHVFIFVQRTTRHLPYDSQCSIIATHKLTGEGMLFTFNPVTGAAVDLGISNLGYRVKQAAPLPTSNGEHLKGILIMDESESIHVYPPSSAQHVSDFYFFVADPSDATVQGFVIQNENDHLTAHNTWIVRLGGSGNNGHRITNVATKSSVERVHSQGKVMGDRSVLYKYVNPNLVVFTTEGPDPVHKDVLNVHLVDVVSGAIIMVQSHRRAKGPVSIVHSENWLVYSYYSEKSRRPEIATMELYEGPQRSGGAFSSLETGRWPPEIARQTYILPAPGPPLTLATTITDRGITAKDILISLTTGAIVELPWVLLDPRRPTISLTNEMREEGLLQYTPELPLPSEAVINYNQTVVNVKSIYTSPSGLESTCLVFAYGLDLFYTRVAPSKTFDLLKEDFDYKLIVLVLMALVISSYTAKRFASRKVLRQAWK